MNNALRSIRILISGLGIVAAGGVQAALVNFSLTGTITSTETYCGTDDDYNDIYCDRPNVFGLVAGDSVIVSGVYDDTHLTGSGSEIVSFESGSGNSLSMVLGSSTFNESSDDGYMDPAPGGVRLLFSDGAFSGLSYYISGGVMWYGNFESYGIPFYAIEQSLSYPYPVGPEWELFGVWDANSFTTTAVPVPAAIWLLSSGLLGFLTLSRRKPGRR